MSTQEDTNCIHLRFASPTPASPGSFGSPQPDSKTPPVVEPLGAPAAPTEIYIWTLFAMIRAQQGGTKLTKVHFDYLEKVKQEARESMRLLNREREARRQLNRN